MKRKLFKLIFSNVIVFSFIIAINFFLVGNVFYLSQANSTFRLVRNQTSNLLALDSVYRNQFDYRKYMNGFYKNVIADIAAVRRDVDKDELKKQFGDYFKNVLKIKAENNHSPSEIEGKLFEAIRTKDKRLNNLLGSLDITGLWNELIDAWNKKAEDLIASSGGKLASYSWFNGNVLNWVITGANNRQVADDYKREDYNALLESIKGLKKGDSLVLIPGSVRELIIDLKAFGKLLPEGVEIKFVLREDRLRDYPTVDDFNKMKNKLRIGGNVEAVTVDTKIPGINLDELDRETTQVLLNSDLLLIQGGRNLISTNRINKEHFVLGSVSPDSFRQTKYFTDLYPEKGEVLSYVAYVPRSVDAASNYDSEQATFYNLSDIVQIDIDKRKSFNGETDDQTMQKIIDSGAGIVLWLAPRSLGNTLEAKGALEEISDSLKNYDTLKEAITGYVNNKLKNEPVFLSEVFELNKYFSGEMLKDIIQNVGGEYKRFAYYLSGNDDWGKLADLDSFSSQSGLKLIGHMVIMPSESADINFFQAGYYPQAEGNFIPASQLIENSYANKKGILINGAYFLPQSLIDEFKRTNPGYDIPDDLEGLYLGFLKVEGEEEVFPPLYNKGTLIVTEKGEILIDRVQLEGGEVKKIEIGGETFAVDKIVDSINVAEPANNEVVIYTPMFEKDTMHLNLFKEKAIDIINGGIKGTKPANLENDMANADSYDKFFNIIDPYKAGKFDNEMLFLKNLIVGLRKDTDLVVKTPSRNGDIVNLVVVGSRVIAVEKGNQKVIIPPFGYVLSMPKDVLGEELINKIVNAEGETTIDFSPTVKLEKEDKVLTMSEIKQAVGGVTLLKVDRNSVSSWNYSKYLEHAGEIMVNEGAHLIFSRRTQATDFALVDDKGPRQVLGLLEKDGEEFLTIFTISGRLKGYGINGANFADLLYVINEELPNGYKIKSLLNLDGGSSASLNYFKEGELYTLSIPGPGPDSKINQMRSVNSNFVIEF